MSPPLGRAEVSDPQSRGAGAAGDLGSYAVWEGCGPSSAGLEDQLVSFTRSCARRYGDVPGNVNCAMSTLKRAQAALVFASIRCNRSAAPPGAAAAAPGRSRKVVGPTNGQILGAIWRRMWGHPPRRDAHTKRWNRRLPTVRRPFDSGCEDCWRVRCGRIAEE
jgi:hypothetical protein